MMSCEGQEAAMERMIVFQDPTLSGVSYVVYVAPGATQWYRVENDVHEFLPSPDRTRPAAAASDPEP
jgi:hypothetical protein